MYNGHSAALQPSSFCTPMPDPILIVEDEPDIRELLAFTLTRAGYPVVEAPHAEQALQILNHQTVRLAVIDWMLPGMSGVDLAYKLRQDDFYADIPIIMLTARSEEADKLKSFDSGTDDYLTKPFSPRELVARIKALLRRAGATDGQYIEGAGIRIDLERHSIAIHGKEIHTGPTEFRLLEFFLSNPNHAFDRSQLLDRVWGRTVYVEERTVDVHVLRLRKLLKPHGLDHLLQTVRGFGYRFSLDSATADESP